ncbi:PTS system ascorbate-specific IIA component [Arcanobacterium pluranimalium]|uniref:PTS sugar transporter subunit IIA n=1 Tax=Arcanobacterium pluranimalium TaxID=108028 RepID=UPI001958C42A|nr:PTS sugar transporter subunit IIA [Arcanobacterium pluranimalium]MBM7825815.1 PTS system ascorbate-specific IIA component [Arcanobacterium pluranimalium]
MPDSTSLLELMPAQAMSVGVHVNTWQEAIEAAGKGLIAGGITTSDYIDEMIQTVNTLGPYIVIAPGFALAHSRPSPSVKTTGLSWVTLAQPVEFGSKRNDPVNVVVGLAALDHDAHIVAMSQLARLIADKSRFAQLSSLTSVDAVREAIESYERNAQ